MKPYAPLIIAGGLCMVVLVLAVGLLDLARGSGAGPVALPPSRSASGQMLNCEGGGQVQNTYAQVGERFVVTGLLASKERDGLLVRGPTGYIRMTLADGSRIEGPYVSGQVVTVTGNITGEDEAEATYVRPACAAAVAAVTPAPTPAPTILPTGAPTPITTDINPTERPDTPTDLEVAADSWDFGDRGAGDRDDDDDDDRDRHGRDSEDRGKKKDRDKHKDRD
jgi:hypothetical protein